jgi:hypothetical protein
MTNNTIETPYIVEVVADRTNKFYGNALKFESIEVAVNYAKDLMSRWLLVSNWRVVDTRDQSVVKQLHNN